MKKLILLPLTFIFLTACQGDDDPGVSRPVAITFGQTGGSPGMEWEKGRGVSRADEDIPGEIPESIGVFAYCNKSAGQEVFNNQKVLYIDSPEYTADQFKWDYWNRDTNQGTSKWPYTITPGGSEQKQWERRKYRFLAYSPRIANGVSLSSNDYDFSAISLTDIPEYSNRDYMIANKIVAVDNTDGARETQVPVTFDMQHLMARIRFIFKMHEDYRKIRRIVINSVSVLSSGRHSTATIAYKADNSLNSISWGSLTDGTPATLTLRKEKDEEYDVKTTYTDATSFASLYVLPQTGFEKLTLSVDYSTYDSAGKETRKAVTSDEIILATPWNLKAGMYYDMKISIVPEYLYVLSDNDQDCDGWVIVKDIKSQ